uniref:Transposase n=1 Tax=Acrobeloides nanus TaxID=290746 RepID=A0A914C9K6_9BILA
MKEFRPAIIRMHERGKGVREIARDLGISPNTVSIAIKRFEETGSNESRKREKNTSRFPFNYAVWSILKEKACSKPHPTVESLKRALKKAWNEISLETFKIVDNFPKRLKACIDANGGHFG